MPTPEAVRDRAAALLAEGAEGVHLDFKSQWYDWNCENKKQDFLFDIACLHNGDGKTEHTHKCLNSELPAAYLVIGADDHGRVTGYDGAVTDEASIGQLVSQRLKPTPHFSVYRTIINNTTLCLIEVGVDQTIGEPVRVYGKDIAGQRRRPARSGSRNTEEAALNTVWGDVLTFFQRDHLAANKQLLQYMLDRDMRVTSSSFDQQLRVLVAEQLPEEDAGWLATIPWHVVVSLGENRVLKTSLGNSAGVRVVDGPLVDYAKKKKARRTLLRDEVTKEVASGRACLFLSSPENLDDKDLGDEKPLKFIEGLSNVRASACVCVCVHISLSSHEPMLACPALVRAYGLGLRFNSLRSGELTTS